MPRRPGSRRRHSCSLPTSPPHFIFLISVILSINCANTSTFSARRSRCRCAGVRSEPDTRAGPKKPNSSGQARICACYTRRNLPRMADNSGQVEIPKRALFRAAEVCDLLKVQPYVLRTWESEFPELRIAKTSGGPRVYRRTDVEQVMRIQHLLLVEGLTLGRCAPASGRGGGARGRRHAARTAHGAKRPRPLDPGQTWSARDPGASCVERSWHRASDSRSNRGGFTPACRSRTRREEQDCGAAAACAPEALELTQSDRHPSLNLHLGVQSAYRDVAQPG